MAEGHMLIVSTFSRKVCFVINCVSSMYFAMNNILVEKNYPTAKLLINGYKCSWNTFFGMPVTFSLSANTIWKAESSPSFTANQIVE